MKPDTNEIKFKDPNDEKYEADIHITNSYSSDRSYIQKSEKIFSFFIYLIFVLRPCILSFDSLCSRPHEGAAAVLRQLVFEIKLILLAKIFN
jgi:hypothetical protein